MIRYDDLLAKVEIHISNLYNNTAPPELYYHNLQHTERVVKHCLEILRHYKLDETDEFIVLVAAWFHDTGHLLGYLQDHERVGSKLMFDYFATNAPELKASVSGEIEECIMATEAPTHPTTLLQEILCDADTYHFGTAAFKLTDPMIKKEMEIRTGKNFINWNASTLQLLKEHRYYTDYCKNLLDKGKQDNIRFVESHIINRA